FVPVVAINHFSSDGQEEIDYVIETCKNLGVKAVVAKEFMEGGDGMKELAHAVVEQIEAGTNKYTPLYDTDWTMTKKIKTIAKEIYGATAVNYTPTAKTQLKTIKALGFDKLPVCMAKTQKSLSDNEKLIGRPQDFEVTVREFEFAAGAGFVIPILGDMMRMPGLPSTPASVHMDIDNDGNITGIS